MPRISSQARQERRHRLISAAWRCLSRQGYRDMTVDDVCTEAGVSKGAFYGYFDSKQSLLVALLEEDAADIDRLMADLERRDAGPVERLRHFTRAMLRRGEESALVQIRGDVWATVLTEPTLREHITAAVQRRRVRLRSWVEEALARSELLLDAPANAVAALLLALGDGLMLHAAIDPTGFRWSNIARAVEGMLEGVTHRPSGGDGPPSSGGPRSE